MTDAVLQLLRDRKQHRSTPGQRTDDARLVLLVEGGSSRGAYSSGMTVAIEQLGLLPMFDAVYGSSAGSLNAAWLLCGRADSSKHAWWDPAVMRTTINPMRAFRRQPVVDTRHLVHTIYTQVVPMGFQDILDNPVEFHPMATDALTGDAADLHGKIHDVPSLQAALRASTAMPLLAGPPVMIDGRPHVDAGLSEMVPVRSAIAQKATHLVVLRTVRTDEIPMSPSRGERMVLSRWLARHAPGVVETWLRRKEGRIEEEELLDSHPACLQIRPPLGSLRVGRTERRPDVLRKVVDIGVRAAMDELASCVLEPPERHAGAAVRGRRWTGRRAAFGTALTSVRAVTDGWRSKVRLVADVFDEFLPPVPDFDTGSLLDDLKAFVTDLAAAWDQPWNDGLVGFLADLRQDAEAERTFRGLVARRSQPVVDAIARAVRRGEIAEVPGLPLVGNLLEGPLMHRRMFGGRPMTAEELDVVTRSVHRLLTGTPVTP